MKLFKKKPTKTVTKYQVKVHAGDVQYALWDIPSAKQAIFIIDNILKSKKKWIRFSRFYFLKKKLKTLEYKSYAEKVKK